MSDPIPMSRIRIPVSSRFLTEESRRSLSFPDEDDAFTHSIPLGNPSDTLSDIQPAWKRELYSLLEQPTSSQAAFLLHVVMTGLIILSAIVTVMETVPAFHYVSPRLWFGLETSLVALFTVEYTVRCVAWSGSWLGLFKWITCTCTFHCSQYLY